MSLEIDLERKKEDTLSTSYTARGNWQKLIKRALKITRGSFEGSKGLIEDYYLEHLDPKHQYGFEHMELYIDLWKKSGERDYFKWLKHHRNTTCEKKRTFVAYLKNKPMFENTKAKIENGFLKPKGIFLAEWVRRISQNKENRLIFVVDKNYNLYVAFKEKTQHGKVQHSSFLDGAPVRLGGFIEIDNNYNIKYISSNTGHYRTQKEHLTDYLKHLKDKKLIDIEKVYVQVFGEKKLLAKEFLDNQI